MLSLEERSALKRYGAAFVPLLGALPGFSNPLEAFDAIADDAAALGASSADAAIGFARETRDRVVGTAGQVAIVALILAAVVVVALRRR